MPDCYADGRLNGRSNGTPSPALTLLLVEADGGRAERMALHLARTMPGLVATRCDTLASARAYLSGTAFDAVCTAAILPDGIGAALIDLRDALGLRAPVFVWNRTDGLMPDRERAAAAAACFILDNADEAEAAAAIGRALGDGGVPTAAWAAPAAALLLEALRAETGAVAHAINNPLTVIAGNAQFLVEMARMGGLDPTFSRPIEDIETATQQLSDALGRLAVLRQRIADSLGVADRL